MSDRMAEKFRLAELIESGLAFVATTPEDQIIEDDHFWFGNRNELSSGDVREYGYRTGALGIAMLGKYGNPAATYQRFKSHPDIESFKILAFLSGELDVSYGVLSAVYTLNSTGKTAKEIATLLREREVY